MVEKTSEYFANVIILAHSTFDDVEYTTDATPERTILQIHGNYGVYKVFITELLSEEIRKYRYYILKKNRVEAGFDNASDPRAIRLKYGKIGSEYAGRYIPHLHLNDKTTIELTENMTFFGFIHWMKENVSLSSNPPGRFARPTIPTSSLPW